MNRKGDALVRYLLPRLQDVLFVSLLAVVLLYGPRLLNQDGDLGRHITIGRYILEHGRIPVQDIFSFTMQGARLVPHEWLSQVLFALAYRIMGLDGDVLLTALVIAVTFLLAYRETVRRGAFHIVGLLVVLWAAAASSLHWLARPHILTFLMAALWSYHLEKFAEKQSRSIWPFPMMMWIWVNLHGAFIVGFVILGIYLLGSRFEFQQGPAFRKTGSQYVMIGLLSLVVTLLNPAGWRIWTNSVGYISNSYLVSHTMEYMPPDFHHPGTWPFLALIALALWALAWGKQLPIRQGLLMAFWGAMALYSARNIPLFAIVTVPVYGELLQGQARKLSWLIKLDEALGRVESGLSGFLWPVLSVVGAAIMLSQHALPDFASRGNSFDPAIFPVQAVDWLQEHPQQGSGFNYFTWGGYLLYRRWPEQQVFIDGQTDFYGEALTREYETVITAASGWDAVLKKYQVSWAIIPAGSMLALELKTAGWKSLYEDGTAVILREP
ncbi:MAG: hypothetical protein ACM3QS_04095 [Bacteroidota bacterium]